MSAMEPDRPEGWRRPGPEILARHARWRAACKALLERFADRLTPDQLEQLREFLFVGELSLLIDNLVAGLVLDQIPVTEADRDALADVLSLFTIPSRIFAFIKDRDEVLATLHVTT
jgi:hypothetical protein